MLGNLVVGLGLNSKGFSKGIDQTKSKLGGFSSFIKGGFLAVGAAITAVAASATLGFGIGLVASAEQAEVAFTTMLGSLDEAKSLLGEIETFAASTPFQLQGLTESAQQLLAFGFAGDSVMGHMKTLGDLAAGTQKPLADFVDIFGKVKATGTAALGDINRLADRGVPIYQALAKTMGQPQSAIKSLASTGKIGLGELQTALESVVSEGGLFEDAMKKQSATLSGVWSTLKDNGIFIVKDLFTALLQGFDLKGSLGGAIEFIQSIRAGLQPFLPLIVQYGTTLKAYMGMLLDFAGMIKDSFVSAFSFVLGESASSFSSMTTLAMGFLVALEFGFSNWRQVAGLAITWVMMKSVSMFGEISHFFTGVIPAVLSGFSDNWRNTFFTAFDLATTVFINLGKNIRNVMGSIWDYIASGGKQSLTLAWTPLTEGFHNSMKEIKIPDRLKSDFEKQLESEFSSLKSEMSTGYGELLQERMKLLEPPDKDGKKKKPPKLPGEDDKPKGGKLSDGSFGAALKGSSEAVSSIVRNVNQSGQNVNEKILTEAQKQSKKMDQQKKETQRTNTLLSKKESETGMVALSFGP